MFIFPCFSHIYSEMQEQETSGDICENVPSAKERSVNIVSFADRASTAMTVITVKHICVVKENFHLAKQGVRLPHYKRKCCKPI